MIRILAICLLLAATFTGPSFSAQNDDLSANDKDFVEFAGETDLLLVRLARLAEMRASSPQLKKFALMLEQEHSADLKKLTAVANKTGGIAPNSLDNMHKDLDKTLIKSKGTSFDHAFLKIVVNQHENALVSYKREADHGFNPDLQAYAKTVLPKLEEHAKQAKVLASSDH